MQIDSFYGSDIAEYSIVKNFTFSLENNKVYSLNPDIYLSSLSIKEDSITFDIKLTRGFDKFLYFIKNNSSVITIELSSLSNETFTYKGVILANYGNMSYTIKDSIVTICIKTIESEFKFEDFIDEVDYLIEEV